MHPSARRNAEWFFRTYGPHLAHARVLDIGAQDLNGSLRSLIPAHWEYVGVDFVPGKGVDVVLDDPYRLPFDTASVDVVISSSCFEHSQLFWLLFLDVMRVLKPAGLFYLNAPANGEFHRHPVDCWRFYPDSGGALVEWGRRNALQPLLLESYTSEQHRQPWNDFVAVFLKDQAHRDRFPDRIVWRHPACTNARTDTDPPDVFRGHQVLPEDQRRRRAWWGGPFRPGRWRKASRRTSSP